MPINRIQGSNQADTLAGTLSDDHIFGSGGDDLVIAGIGHDLVYGGDGNDIVKAEKESYQIVPPERTYGGAGEDTISGELAFGGAGNDTIIGTRQYGTPQYAFGGSGNDNINHLDVSQGAAYGGTGDDFILGGRDGLLVGGNGADHLSVRRGGNILVGGDGADVFRLTVVQNEHEYPHATYENRLVHNTITDFEVGVDKLQLNLDLMVPPNFNHGTPETTFRWDEIRIQAVGSDTRVIATAQSSYSDRESFKIRVLLKNVEASDLARDDFLLVDGPTTLTGTNGIDRLYGTRSNDIIKALEGSDKIYGDAGNDRIFAGGGNNKVEGGMGNDVIFTGAGSDIIYGGTGIDRVFAGAGNDYIGGNAGNDRLFAGAGNDIVSGGAGHDTLHGGDGDDLLYGGPSGGNKFWGGAGADVFVISPNQHLASDQVMDFETGVDKISLSGATAQSFDELSFRNSRLGVVVDYGNGSVLIHRITQPDIADSGNFLFDSGSLQVAPATLSETSDPATNTAPVAGITFVGTKADDYRYGQAGNDKLAGHGGNDELAGRDGSDRIWGGSGNDTLSGDNGNDRIFGGDDADKLSGGKGNDRLFGGAGDDTLIGGRGDDVLTSGKGWDILLGGFGADTFVFDASKGWRERVLDFETGTDMIRLNGTTATRFSDLKIQEATLEEGDGVLVNFGNGSVFLLDTTLDAINDAANFEFV